MSSQKGVTFENDKADEEINKPEIMIEGMDRISRSGSPK